MHQGGLHDAGNNLGTPARLISTYRINRPGPPSPPGSKSFILLPFFSSFLFFLFFCGGEGRLFRLFVRSCFVCRVIPCLLSPWFSVAVIDTSCYVEWAGDPSTDRLVSNILAECCVPLLSLSCTEYVPCSPNTMLPYRR